MCQTNNPRRIDPCMKKLVKNIKLLLQDGFWPVACCCGHGRYPMTIVLRCSHGEVKEICHDIIIPRKSRFYVKDKDGYYFIPETLEAKP